MNTKCPKCETENPSDSKFCKECATPLPPSEEISVPTETMEAAIEELSTGSTFAGRYQIIEELGKGGMGKVYRAVDKKLNEEMALKLIKPEIALDKKTIGRFSNELKLARKISHRNVGRMYELMEEEGTHFITMEYVPGEDLKSFIRRAGPLSAGKTIFIAKQVCEGLTEAHRLGVIHRDLKPQNIMIDKEGNARIMDFGIARTILGKGITGAGVMIGTPEYMSPEQAEVKEVDQRSDIYSLGVILYEMVTGRVPFEGETPLGIAMKHKSEIPKDPKELNAQIPEDLSRVIMRCLEKDKKNRYQSAQEVRSELAGIEEGIPTTEREIPKRKPITSREITVTFRLKKIFLPGLVAIALIVAAVIIWQLLPQKRTAPLAPEGKPSLAVMYFENNTGDESLDHWRKAISDLLITDLSQSKHLRVLSGENLFAILRNLNLLDAKSYSLEDLEKVAAEGGMRYVLVGKYAKAGENIRIDSMLQDASTGELLGSQRAEDKGLDKIFSMVDELTPKIKEDLKLTPQQIERDIDYFVGKITSNSPEAYAYFTEGMKYFDMIDYSRCIPLLEKAIEIDPEFATAYALLHAAYHNSGYEDKASEYMQKAFDLRHNASDRQRYQLEGSYYMDSEETINKAIEAFEKLLELYPEDAIGNNHLGIIYSRLEEWDKAASFYEMPVKLKGKFVITYSNLAWTYRRLGQLDKAREVYENYLNNFSDHPSPHRGLADIYMRQRKFDLAQKEVNKAFQLAPDYRYNPSLKGHLSLFKGDFVTAEKEYLKLLDNPEVVVQVDGRWYLGDLHLLQGQFERSKEQFKLAMGLAKETQEREWEFDCLVSLAYIQNLLEKKIEAQENLDRALKLAEELNDTKSQIEVIHRQGLVHLDTGSLEKAKKAADKIKSIVEKGLYKKQIRYLDHLMGEIELKRGNFSKAVEHFQSALSLAPYDSLNNYAIFMNFLAFAYYKKGDFEKAREEYEKITLSTYGRRPYGDIYAKSFYMLGKIYEKQGNKPKAKEHYQKFLDLWKDADPGMPDVDDAKKRLK